MEIMCGFFHARKMPKKGDSEDKNKKEKQGEMFSSKADKLLVK